MYEIWIIPYWFTIWTHNFEISHRKDFLGPEVFTNTLRKKVLPNSFKGIWVQYYHDIKTRQTLKERKITNQIVLRTLKNIPINEYNNIKKVIIP